MTAIEVVGAFFACLAFFALVIMAFCYIVLSIMRELDKSAGLDVDQIKLGSSFKVFLLYLMGFPEMAKEEQEKNGGK